MAAPNAKRGRCPFGNVLCAMSALRQHADASSAKARDSEKKQLRAKTKRPPRKRDGRKHH